jgi:type I restriction enzyme, S subunit
MKEVWAIKKLGEVCEVITKGTTPTSVGFQFTEKGVNFIKVESLTESGEIIPHKVAYVSDECHKSLKRSQLKANDILFSIAGALGRIGIVKEEIIPANTNQALAIVRLAENSGILVDYLAKYFLSGYISKEIGKLKGGVAQQNLSLGQLNNLLISIPPIKEQQRIVSILEDAFSAIDQAQENVQRNLQNANELFQSELNCIFTNKGEGWVEKKLAEVSVFFGRGKSKHRPRNDEKLYGGVYPFIQTGDVRNAHKFITQYTQTYNKFGLAQSKLWPKGTICITIAANIAETGILDFDSCFPDSIIGLVVDNKKADVVFTYYALQFLKSELQLLGKGSAQDNINMGTFETQRFPFPALDIQKRIVHRLDLILEETKKLEEKYQQKLNALDDLKKGILEKAFKGELKEREILL